MRKEGELSCSVSGSFSKYKKEIDLVIDEFTDLGVKVLAPEKGPVIKPFRGFVVVTKDEFNPLASEVGMSIKEIEDKFLENVARSVFLYVYNRHGYVGISGGMEIGFALGKGIPIYSLENIIDNGENDLWLRKIVREIKIASPKEVVDELRNG